MAFRLTLWYAGIFTVSMVAALLAFYWLGLKGGAGISRHALSELKEHFRHYFGGPVAVVVALAASVGWFMAKRALAGIDEITRTAVDISKGALDRRAAVKGGGNEIDRLAGAFNTMVDRVNALLSQMREMTDNIAHDLRSPITRMRGVAEMALAADPGGDQAAMAGTIVDECDRLLGMIDTMLDISEAEAGLAAVKLDETDMAALLSDVGDLFQPLAEEKEIAVAIDAAGPLAVPCDARKLSRVFANLLDNAIKYTPPGGRVRISAARKGPSAVVTVEDTGEGIGEADLPHIFDRFYRGEKSRSKPGSGLGLSLARALVLAHGGAITASSEKGRGASFIVTLPASQGEAR